VFEGKHARLSLRFSLWRARGRDFLSSGGLTKTATMKKRKSPPPHTHTRRAGPALMDDCSGSRFALISLNELTLAKNECATKKKTSKWILSSLPTDVDARVFTFRMPSCVRVWGPASANDAASSRRRDCKLNARKKEKRGSLVGVASPLVK